MKNRIKTTDFEVGKVYGGTLVGDIFKTEDGKYWWRRTAGELQEINPHPDALWIEKEETDNYNSLLLL